MPQGTIAETLSCLSLVFLYRVTSLVEETVSQWCQPVFTGQLVKNPLRYSDRERQSIVQELGGLGSQNGSAFTGYMPLGRLLDYPTSQFPHLKNEDNNLHWIL